MHERDSTAKPGRILAVAALSLWLAGCSGMGLFGGQSSDNFLPPMGADGNYDGRALTDYLEVLRRLVDGDPVTQAEVFRETSQAAEAWPTTTNRLRLALAMATPGHPWTDAAEAERRLSGLLAANNALLPEERILATLYLKQVEQRLILDAEARRLHNEAEQTLAQESSTNARALQAALEENRRLREELADAREKLEAITNIERSIRERESATDTP